jgi:hypothetical protein
MRQPGVRFSMGRLIGIRPTALIVLGWLALSSFGCLNLPKNPMTVEQAQARVDEAVPMGATREQVESWLESQGIGCSYHLSAAKEFDVQIECIETGEFNPEDLGGCVSARIPSKHQDLFSWDIKLIFVLDKNGRTVRHLVTGIGNGL